MQNDPSAALKNEIAKIRKIQVSLLPDFKQIREYEIDFAYLPAHDLSGDFFDGFYVGPDEYQIVLCDVSGHGMASAYVGNEIRTMFRLASSSSKSLEETVGDINSILAHELHDLYYFCTAVVLRINLKTGLIRYLNGGHPAPFHYSTASGEIRPIEQTGPLIGIFKQSIFKTTEFSIGTGDSLLLYTDGLTEASNEEDRDKGLFGEERLMEAFAENLEFAPRDIIHLVLGQVYEFTDYTEQADDITVLCIRKK